MNYTNKYLKIKPWLPVTMVVLCLFSCSGDQVLTPKPRMYPKVEFPDRKDTSLVAQVCPFTFQYPDYLTFQKDSSFFNEAPKHGCWFNLNSKALNYSIHFSYIPIHNNKEAEELIEDSFELANKHNTKASFRKESPIENQYKVKGLLFEMEGNVASPIQYYMTDNKSHFLRASLYFNAKVNPDSTAPVLQFLHKDLMHIIETTKWTK